MKKIKYGHEDYGQDEFDPRFAKARITTFIDLDVLDEIRKNAKKKGEKYQTLLNKMLRDSVFAEKNDKKLIKDLEERISILERVVLKKKTS